MCEQPSTGLRIENGEYVSFIKQALSYNKDGNLTSGSIEDLIHHLVPTVEYYPEKAYLFAFLLSARLYVKPHDLLSQICRLCVVQQKMIQETRSKEELFVFCPKIIKLLSEWTDTFPYDFRDERMITHVRSLTQRCVLLDSRVKKDVKTLLKNLLHQLTSLEKYEEFLRKVQVESSSKPIHLSDVTEVCPRAEILCHQLTHIELERLGFIGPEEFVQAFAKENSKIDSSFRDLKNTSNLESYVQWFNRLSYFVATEICLQQKKKTRVRLIEFFIEVARECFNIGNFNSLMAIIAGLSMSPVSRLKKTWAKVNTAKLDVLEHQMAPNANFSSYRSTLKAAMWRAKGALDGREKIVIPFFSLLVKDIYFLNEGCVSRLANGHVNFEKFWNLAKQVAEFISWKQVTCPFQKQPKVINYLLTKPVFTENTLALASFDCEPPENHVEKDRLKALKSELHA